MQPAGCALPRGASSAAYRQCPRHHSTLARTFRCPWDSHVGRTRCSWGLCLTVAGGDGLLPPSLGCDGIRYCLSKGPPQEGGTCTPQSASDMFF